MWKIKDLNNQKITIISNDVSTFGRNVSADIVSKQRHVSRIHAKLFKRGTSLYVKDNEVSFCIIVEEKNLNLNFVC